MGIVEVPVFSDVELRQWISWMENYFDRKGLTDFEKLHMADGFIVGEAERYIDSLKTISSWKELKETLLLKFGADDDPEKMILKAESDKCYNALMNGDSEKRRVSQWYSSVFSSVEPTVEVPYSNLEQNETDSQLGYQKINMEVDLHVDIPVFSGRFPFDWICRAERFFDSGRYNDMEKLKLISLSFEGSALHWFNAEMEKEQFSDWSQFTDCFLDRYAGSSDTEPVPEIASKATALGCSSPEGLRTHQLTSVIVQEAISTDATELFDNVLSHEKDKVKNETIAAVDHEADLVLTEESVHELQQETALQSDSGFTGSLELSGSLIEDELHETYSSATEACTEKIAEMYSTWTKNLQPPRVEAGCEYSMDGLSMSSVIQPHSFANMISSKEKMFWKARQWEVTEIDEEAKRFQTVCSKSHGVQKTFTHSHLSGRLVCKKKQLKYPKAWKFKFKPKNFQRRMLIRFVNIKPVFDLESGDVFLKLEHPLLSSQRFHSQDASVAERSQSTVKHKWRFKQRGKTRSGQRHLFRLLALKEVIWQWVDHVGYSYRHFGVSEHGFRITVSANGKELQPHGSFHENSYIISLSSSLWASLFSRVGVYESILICLWIVAVLIWRYDREENKESELLIQEPFRVSSFLNRLPLDNGLLLMQHEGNLIRVRVQQSHKKKKSFKTYMFKYKQQLSKISVWTEVLQPNVQGAYMFDRSGDDGKVQSRDCGGLWNGWCVHEGNKVMQQRRRSKMLKSWMFKYKDKVETSAVTFDISRSYKAGKNEVLISPILIFSMSTSSSFLLPSLRASLISLGEVLIDTNYLYMDLAYAEADVDRKQSK